jgi:dihydrofolate reductase
VAAGARAEVDTDRRKDLRKVVVSEFVTLDGVMEDPGGAEGFARGGWAFQFERGPEGDKFKLDEVLASDALLLGRRTYQGFAEAWPSRTDEVGFADKMNAMPKFVVSTTMQEAEWNNSTVIAEDVAEVVSRLKQKPGGDILVAGSGELVHTLLEHDLVDELRLMVFPVVLGSGKRLFRDGIDPKAMRLVETKETGAVVILTFRRAPDATE